MKFILYNNESKRYYAGVTNCTGEGGHNCVVTSDRKVNAKIFDKKKDAKKSLEFLKNGGHPSFEIIELNDT